MTSYCLYQKIYTDSSETMCELCDDFCMVENCPYKISKEDYENALADIQYDVYRDLSLIF